MSGGCTSTSYACMVCEGITFLMSYIQGVQIKSGLYLVFSKKSPFVHLISAKICGEIL